MAARSSPAAIPTPSASPAASSVVLSQAESALPDDGTNSPDALAEKAVAVMQSKKITSLFVVDPEGTGHAVGLIHIHDCLRAGVV